MHISSLFSAASLDDALAQGYVRRQVHGSLPLSILNYTEKTQYEYGAWNEVTTQCRGLIVDDKGEVVARPFRKFWNYGERGDVAPSYYHSPVTVTDKYDGSLGIYYEYDGVRAVATRGSFHSTQAVHATLVLNSSYPDYRPQPGMTPMWEIIYPGNRIVLDYEDMDDLVLIGAVSIEDGWTAGPFDPDWPGPRAQVFEVATFQAAIEMPPRPNAEGIVVHFHDLDLRLKIKQADYVALHRILTGTTARTVWEFLAVSACKDLIKVPKHWGSRVGISEERAAEILAAGDQWEEKLLKGVPDEFHAWLRSTIDGLYAQVGEMLVEATDACSAAAAVHRDRKGFALAVKDHPLAGLIFLIHDGKDVTTHLWKSVYPAAGRPFASHGEDVA